LKRGCLVQGAAIAMAALALLLAYVGWTDTNPWEWRSLYSPTFDLRTPGEFEWSLPPTDWDPARGEPQLELLTGHDWQRLPMQEDCRIRVRLRDRVTHVDTHVVLERQDLAWGISFVANCDPEAGFDAWVTVEQGNPAIGVGQLRVEGSFERDNRDMDFVGEYARKGAMLFLAGSVVLGLVALRQKRSRAKPPQ
jgi:hypothetical protein